MILAWSKRKQNEIEGENIVQNILKAKKFECAYSMSSLFDNRCKVNKE